MLHTRSRRIFVAAIIALALTLIFIALGAGQKTVAGGGLPPRPTTSPTPVMPTATPTAVPAIPVNGAAIRLYTSEPAPGAWTVVQWQNEQGNWYDVVGWRGHLDDGQADMKTWWVYPTNFGEGPFRWVVYGSPTGPKLVTSETFDLPTHNGQLVIVEVELP